MSKYRTVIVVSVLALFLTGCAGVLKAIKDTSEQSKIVQQDIERAITNAEATIAKLPEGDPLRLALEGRVKAAKETVQEIGRRIEQADRIVADLEKGVVSPELVAAATGIPFVGPYIPALAVLIPSILALIKSGQAAKYKDGFIRVVKSWRDVGAELTSAERAAVADIQGDKVTALVHAVKDKLPPSVEKYLDDSI